MMLIMCLVEREVRAFFPVCISQTYIGYTECKEKINKYSALFDKVQEQSGGFTVMPQKNVATPPLLCLCMFCTSGVGRKILV